MSRRRYKVRLQPLFGKSVIAGAPVFDFLLPYCKSIHSMPIFAVFLCLLTKKANFHRMLAAEDYVDGVSRKLQPVIRNDDKCYAACRRIFLLRMRQAERKQSAETETCSAAFRRHIGKTAVFGGVCFGCYAVFAAESEEWLRVESALEWRQNAVRKVFATFISSRERRRAFFCTGFARSLPGIRSRRAVV